MRRIAICDDQREIAIFISIVCEAFYSTKQGVELHIFHRGEDIVNCPNHFDIIFMDVELDNVSGIEAGIEIRKTDRDVIIIMISGNEMHKMNAFTLHAYDFLDKPLSQEQLINTLTEVEILCSDKKEKIFITVKMKNGFTKLDILDILYFEYIKRKMRVITLSGSFEFYGNISKQAECMKGYGFGIPHASYIVNFFHIQSIIGKEIILENGTSIPLSRYKAKEFRDAFSKYIQNQIAVKGW